MHDQACPPTHLPSHPRLRTCVILVHIHACTRTPTDTPTHPGMHPHGSPNTHVHTKHTWPHKRMAAARPNHPATCRPPGTWRSLANTFCCLNIPSPLVTGGSAPPLECVCRARVPPGAHPSAAGRRVPQVAQRHVGSMGTPAHVRPAPTHWRHAAGARTAGRTRRRCGAVRQAAGCGRVAERSVRGGRRGGGTAARVAWRPQQRQLCMRACRAHSGLRAGWP